MADSPNENVLPLFADVAEIDFFQRGIVTSALGKKIHFFKEAGSTNDMAIDAAKGGAEHGTVYVADSQFAGRGRRGRVWDCPPAQGLLFSVLTRPRAVAQSLGWIPLLAGLSCAEACASLDPKLASVSIKWPNDIVVPSSVSPGWRKLGGVLCESAMTASNLESDRSKNYAVIGIGLNVNQTQIMLPKLAKAPPTSLLTEAGIQFDRVELLREMLEKLEANLSLLESEKSLTKLRENVSAKMCEWMKLGRRVQFHSPAADVPKSAALVGEFAGLDEFGRLLILRGGKTEAYADAEIIALD